MTTCPICLKEFKQLHGSHIRTHNLTTVEFKQQYPDIWLGNKGTYEYGQLAKELRLATEEVILCIHCGNRITDKYRKQKKFCNSSCSASYNNIRKPSRKKVESSKCINCGNIFTRYRAKAERFKFCSLSCHCKYKSETSIKTSTNLLLEGKLTDLSRNRIKKTLLHIGVKNECSICKITEWLGKPLPLILDHIDGCSDNNTIENLRLICSNCDSQTDHYKGKNKGRGRKALKNKGTLIK